ncbi:VQ motif-containing protein [Raphanus sativus]|uniref:Uncharacterized protein LOC108840294 n=1 Tax=Raphanus sativus TaxID=3726 RepID=A0A6J0M985_RAPSA|nr:uncharacterized protein LOC108840294 [Raphanus sativus]KAJ4872555.1 VQ motif-containing protein [Raphanus sativus]
MESGNSSSMQSSSGGGGEEYDSRAADQSISAFFDHHNHHVASLPPPQQNHLNPLHFDHNNSLIPQNYFNNNNGIFLPINQQSDPNTQPDLRTFSSTSPSIPPNNIGVIKKTKKRSRASRRAPTTVLKTDTSNFRAMVQEFTGIPSPPLFNNNSVVNTMRLNTFLGLSSSTTPNSNNSNNNILLRPFAQKLLPTSPLLSGSQIQQYQNPNNSFENMNLQSLLQAQISNPRSNDHDQFGLSMLQSQSITPLTTTTIANGNVTTGENGGYGVSYHDHNNDNTWLCSSSDQRT